MGTAERTAVFEVGQPAVLTLRLPAVRDPHTDRPAVTAGDLGRLCRVPPERVVGLAILASAGGDAATVPVVVRVLPHAEPGAPAPVPAPAPDDLGGAAGDPLAAIMGLLAGTLQSINGGGIPPPVLPPGLPPVPRPGPGRPHAAPPGGGVAAALVDVEVAARVLGLEFGEGLRNERCSRDVAQIVRLLPALVADASGPIGRLVRAATAATPPTG